MTPDATQPVLVVGYDGSDAARAAVDHAIEAVHDGGRLIVVHAYEVPADYIGASYYQQMLDTSLDRANKVIEELSRSEPRLAAVEWESHVTPGDAAIAITRAAEAEGADGIVIGTRGVGRIRGLLGSVAHDVLHQATCPVTVIPQRIAAPPPVAA